MESWFILHSTPISHNNKGMSRPSLFCCQNQPNSSWVISRLDLGPLKVSKDQTCLSSTSHRCLTGWRSGKFRGQVNSSHSWLCSSNHFWTILPSGRVHYLAETLSRAQGFPAEHCPPPPPPPPCLVPIVILVPCVKPKKHWSDQVTFFHCSVVQL